MLHRNRKFNQARSSCRQFGAMAGRAYERVDFESLLQEGRTSAGGLSRRESWRLDDQPWRSAVVGSA